MAAVTEQHDVLVVVDTRTVAGVAHPTVLLVMPHEGEEGGLFIVPYLAALALAHDVATLVNLFLDACPLALG